MRFILGPLIVAAGIATMKYSVKIAEFTGMIGFAEKYLSGGLAGTYTLYRIVGLLLCALGLAYLFGWFNFIPETEDLSIPVESFLYYIRSA